MKKRTAMTADQDRIKNHGSRWTVPRGEILSILIRSERHLSAKELYALLHPAKKQIGLTTVYRTLELLDKVGLVRKIHLGDAGTRYEYKRHDRADHHHHLICTQCGKIINYRDFEKEELDLVRKTKDILSKKFRFHIRDHNIEFLGLCEDCRPGGKKSIIG